MADLITNAPNQYQIMLDNYASIVEKTNQQMNLWLNPYAILIAALGVLFTAGAIVAAVLLYRQSQDYKKQVELDRKTYAQKVNEILLTQKEIIKNNNKKIEEGTKKINVKIEEYEKKLKMSAQRQKKKIQEKIDNLELEKLRLDITPAHAITVNPEPLDYIGIGDLNLNKKLIRCSNPKCGFNFYVNTGGLYTGTLIRNTAVCPKCGNINSI